MDPDTDLVFFRNFLLARMAELAPESESDSESRAASSSSMGGGREELTGDWVLFVPEAAGSEGKPPEKEAA